MMKEEHKEKNRNSLEIALSWLEEKKKERTTKEKTKPINLIMDDMYRTAVHKDAEKMVEDIITKKNGR